MKRRILLVTLSLALIAQLALSVNSYPGIAGGGLDCINCHNEPAMTGYDGTFYDADILLDGHADEDLYMSSGHIYVSVANNRDPHSFDLVSSYFGQNSTHIFVNARIHDDDTSVVGTDTPYYGVADKMALLWNMNASTVGNSYSDGMANSYGDGEAVDLWMWAPTADETHENTMDGESYYLEGSTYDGMYFEGTHMEDSLGWGEDHDVMAAGYYERDYVRSSYAHNLYVEFARPLETGNNNDIQFKTTGWYEYTMAVWMGSNGNGHWVSFSHYVWVVANDGAAVVTDGGAAANTTTVTDVNLVHDYNTVVVTEEVVAGGYTEYNMVTTTVAGVDNDKGGETSDGDDTPVPTVAVFFAIATVTTIVYRKRR